MANFYAKYSASSPSGATVTANQGTNPWIVAGSGTAGTAATGVVTVQGIAGGVSVPVTTTIAAVNSVVLFSNNYASSNVTTGAYVELVASTSAIINKLYVFDSSGATLALAVGAATTEVQQFYIFPGGIPGGAIDLRIPAGSRISIISIDTATVNSGFLYVTATS